MREKLIKLLDESRVTSNEHCVCINGSEYIADYLIDNGVTVQEWIPVTEPPTEAGEYIVMIKNGASATTLLFDGDFWFEEDAEGWQTHYAVTHWMPLPEAPKGE